MPRIAAFLLLTVLTAPAAADDLQLWLDCDPAMPEDFGVLLSPSVKVEEINTNSEMHGAWRITLRRARTIHGYRVKTLRAHASEPLNYFAAYVTARPEHVAKALTTRLGAQFTPSESTGEQPIFERTRDAPNYRADGTLVEVYPAYPRGSWIVCNDDRTGS